MGIVERKSRTKMNFRVELFTDIFRSRSASGIGICNNIFRQTCTYERSVAELPYPSYTHQHPVGQQTNDESGIYRTRLIFIIHPTRDRHSSRNTLPPGT